MKRVKKIIIAALLLITLFFIFIFIYWRLETKVTNNVDSYIYALPFKVGTKHKVVQGYGGYFSHKNIAAIDFGMPVGTPIYAAREGIVYHYKDNENEGGPFAKYKNKANYIIIKHKDGSFGCYWHLQHNGVLVKNGVVEKGKHIGYSGNTGFVLYPHLHFTVKNKLNYDKDSFVKTKFSTTKGILFLQRGESYERPKE